MKAIVCVSHGMPEDLKYVEIEKPTIGENDILIKVAVCSVNFPDALIIQNKYQFKPELPFSPGSEVSGIVGLVGQNVKNFKLGDRVLALCGWGGMAEYLIVEPNKVFLLPDYMSYAMGASLMYNFGTSYHALKDRAKLQKGETILIMGASGGVGLAALQLAKIMGAKVIAAASSYSKLEICKQYGADHVINYDQEDIKQKVKEITNGHGVDVIYDPVGDKYAEPALRSMAWQGRYLVVGFAAGEIPKIPLNLTLLKGCQIMGVFWGQFVANQYRLHVQNTKQICEWFGNGLIKAHIFKEYDLEDSPLAIRDMMERKVSGKSLVVIDKNLFGQNVAKTESLDTSFKTVFKSREEIMAFIGRQIGESPYLMIDQARIQSFADATLDHQWIHINEKKAKGTPFGGTIVHGFLTLSMSVHLLEQVYAIENTVMGINYGCDKVRFIQPLKSGAKVKIAAELISVDDMPNNGLKMKIEARYFSSDNSKPICIAELLSVVYFAQTTP